MVRRSIDQKHRLRNFDARHGRLETGAVIKNRKGMSGVEAEKDTCYQWKEKASVRKETNAVSGMRVTIVPKNQTTTPSHLSSHPCHEVEVCRRKEVSEAKVTMVPFTDNRADTSLKGTCTRSPNEYRHPPECQFTKQKRDA